MATQPELVGPCNTSPTWVFCNRKHGRLFSADLVTAVESAYPKLPCLDEVTQSLAVPMCLHAQGK